MPPGTHAMMPQGEKKVLNASTLLFYTQWTLPALCAIDCCLKHPHYTVAADLSRSTTCQR